MPSDSDIGRHIEAAAKAIFGNHNARLSKKNDLRFGSNGSFSVDPSKGQWYDHEAKEGGGVLDLLKREKGLVGVEAVDWLRSIGCAIEDRRGAQGGQRRRSDDTPPWDEAPPPPAGLDDYGRGGASPGGAPEPNDPAQEALRKGPTRVYAYEDMSGELVLEVCRYEWMDQGKKHKTFRQRRPPGPKDKPKSIRNGYVWSLNGISLVPYGLPRLAQAIAEGQTIYIAEGEKDVETLWDWGIAATCNPQGSGKWPDEFDQYFQNAKKIVLLEDNDEAGRHHVAVVGAAMRRIGVPVYVVDFREMPPKSDVTDWAETGKTDDDLFEKTERAKPWKPEVPRSAYGAVRFIELEEPAPDIEWLWDEFLTCGDKSIIGGASQSGKSFLGINLGLHIAGGTPFLGRETMQGLVCYQAGESARGARRRMKAFRIEHGVAPDLDLPFVLLSKRIDLFSKDSGDVQGLIDEVKAWQAYYVDYPLRWLCIDTLARAAVGAEENSAKDMGIVLDNMDRLENALGCAVSAVHHMNAIGSKLRGSSAVYANVEQVLAISRDPETNVRTIRVDKMKDEADGGTQNFELKVHELGIDKRGKKITSCVVMPAGWKDGRAGEQAPEAHDQTQAKRFRLRKNETAPFLAILAAIRDHGESAPPEIAEKYGLPPERRVVRWPFVLEAFEKSTDETDPERIAKLLGDVGTSLRKFRVIERENPFIWWTGKPVEGFAETYPPRSAQSRKPDETKSAADEPMVDEYF